MARKEKPKIYDRYELAGIKRDVLRKMLTVLRKEELRVSALIQAANVDSSFTDGLKTRAKRKEINTKLRVINEYLRIQNGLNAVGKDGRRAIIADKTLSDYIDRRNAENEALEVPYRIKNTPEMRKAFSKFAKDFKASIIGKVVYKGDAVDFFEKNGENSSIEDMLKLYEGMK